MKSIKKMKQKEKQKRQMVQTDKATEKEMMDEKLK